MSERNARITHTELRTSERQRGRRTVWDAECKAQVTGLVEANGKRRNIVRVTATDHDRDEAMRKARNKAFAVVDRFNRTGKIGGTG